MRPRLSQDFISEHKRIRIMEAATRVVSRQGVEGSKIDDLVAEAGVARNTFYETFKGKDDCLEQALGWVGDQARSEVIKASEDGGGPGTLARRGVEALLDFIAEQPDQARCYLIYGPTISRSIFEAEQKSFAQLLKPLGLEASIREMLVGGISLVLYRHFGERTGEDPRHLLDELVAFVTSSVPADSLVCEAVAA